MPYNLSYLKMIAAATVGGQVINYSSRFTIDKMTGTWATTAAQADFKTVSGTAGPPTQNQVSENAAAGAGAGAPQGDYTIPYALQSGLTKYAPMQSQPGTKITAKATKPIYAKSAVQYAITFLPTPSQVTTLTQSVTFSVSSMENTVSCAYLLMVGGLWLTRE